MHGPLNLISRPLEELLPHLISYLYICSGGQSAAGKRNINFLNITDDINGEGVISSITII
jgi:hypothetical protein